MCPLRHTLAELRQGEHERMHVLYKRICVYLFYFLLVLFYFLSDLSDDWAWVWDLLSSSLWIVALYTYTLITKHGYHVGPVPCVLHVHAHTHTHSLAQ